MKLLNELLVRKKIITLSSILLLLSFTFVAEIAFARHNPYGFFYHHRAYTKHVEVVSTSSAKPSDSQTLGTSTTTVSTDPEVPQPVVAPTVKPKGTGSSTTPTLPTAKVAFGIATDSYNNQNGELTALQQTLGVKLSSVSMYKEFGGSFNPGDFSYLKAQNIKLLLAWEPWNAGELAKISAGADDNYISNFATSVKTYGGPVVLRFAHEMDGNWYPWGNDAINYISAYRHIHDVFANVGVSNVTWMWSPNATWDGAGITPYYPGNDVVDVIGMDEFNFGTTQNYGGWQTFTTLFGPTYQVLTATYNKPLEVSETGSVEFGGDKAKWITDMFTAIATKYPKIKEVVWFNLLKAENGTTTDWRVNSTASSQQAFINYFK